MCLQIEEQDGRGLGSTASPVVAVSHLAEDFVATTLHLQVCANPNDMV